MSDDPSDDALEGNPSAGIAGKGHRPRLSEESRGVNVRDMRHILDAERESRDDRNEAPRHAEPPPPMPRSILSGSVLGGRRTGPMPVPSQGGGPYRSPIPTRSSDEATAWDRYIIGALPLVIGLGLEDPEGIAAQLADKLLEERRRRFG